MVQGAVCHRRVVADAARCSPGAAFVLLQATQKVMVLSVGTVFARTSTEEDHELC